ncbi:Uncharacterised protein [Vibrio cholerae]|nr:Uncharacterised protein [Vibrio cholerae]CSD09628.1 Uncharacterised protein [Vibrio cholerae]CSD17317.1 Uncharacterised protein [Vibrio cholerae]
MSILQSIANRGTADRQPFRACHDCPTLQYFIRFVEFSKVKQIVRPDHKRQLILRIQSLQSRQHRISSDGLWRSI